MIHSVKARTCTLALILFVFGIGNAFAETKVVVIPMAADAPTGQWALVKSNGTVITGSGVVSSTRLLQGVYIVEFGTDALGHAVIATPRSSSRFILTFPCGFPAGATGEAASCSGLNNTPRHVLVYAYNTSGVFADSNFYLAILP